MMNDLKKYKIPFWERFFYWTLLINIILMQFGMIAFTIKDPDAIFCFGITFFISFIVVIPIINLNPTIGITDEYLMLITIIGTKKAIKWQDVLEINRPKLSFFPGFYRRITNRKQILMVKVKNQGLLFRLFGLMYDGNGQGFLLNPKIEQYSELVQRIKIYSGQSK